MCGLLTVYNFCNMVTSFFDFKNKSWFVGKPCNELLKTGFPKNVRPYGWKSASGCLRNEIRSRIWFLCVTWICLLDAWKKFQKTWNYPKWWWFFMVYLYIPCHGRIRQKITSPNTRFFEPNKGLNVPEMEGFRVAPFFQADHVNFWRNTCYVHPGIRI